MSVDWTSEIAKNMFGDSPYQHRAREALPLLVRQAAAGQKIYYGDLARELRMPNPRNLNYVLGSVGTTLHELGKQWGEEIPAIQCVVINQQTGLPGSGVDRMIAGVASAELDQPQKEALVQGILANVFAYPKWPQVLETLNLEAPKPVLDATALQRAGYGGGKGESDEHKSLKEYIAEHPECVGIAKSTAPGETEYLLPSGDKIDVLFTNRRSVSRRVVALTAVEVKTHVSDELDLKRGLFQCVKYDALLRACRSVEMTSYEVTVLLALEGVLPDTLIPVKNTLGVRVLERVRPENSR